MKRQYKTIYYVLLFCIIITFKTFSYNKSKIDSYDSPSSTGYADAHSDVVFNQLMNLKDVKIRFTQDDAKYYFNITGNSSVKIYGSIFSSSDSSCASGIFPILYKENNFSSNIRINESYKVPYYDKTAGNFHQRSKVTINNKVQSDYDFSYRLSSGTATTTNDTLNKNGELYFVPRGLRPRPHSNGGVLKYATNYPINSANNGIGISVDRNSSSSYFTWTGSYYDTYCANYNVSISINKNYFDHYRYLCFAHSMVAAEYSSFSDTSYSYTGLSLSTNTLDLKEYVNCEHNWVYKPKSKSSHTICCDKCEWEKEEPHTLLYEYDGLKNNVCTCSYIDKVKYVFYINDDVTSKIEEVCDTECEYNKHPFTHKTGYNFKWYEKYKKTYVDSKNLSTVSNAVVTNFISTTSELDDVAGEHSVKYIAKYSPIKYTFNYSDVKDFDLKTDEKIDSQVVYYDETASLKKAIDFKGYVFKGWSLDKGDKKIDFNDQEDVTNYTTVDLKEYDLYPIYERLDYTIVYSAGGYTFDDGKKEKTVHYDFFNEGELEKPYIRSNDLIYDGYIDEYGNRYKKLSDVQEVIEKMKKSNATLYLKLALSSVGIGRPERTLKETTTPIGKWNETTSVEEMPTDYSYLYETTYNRNIVSGMSGTKERIVEEETEQESDVKSRIATISLINKFNFDNDSMKKSKLAIIREFIENHKVLCTVVGSLFIVFLILYEVLLIKRYCIKTKKNA